MSDMERLKFNLQEAQFPYFSDAECQNLIEQYKDIREASYQGCMIKAQNDAIDMGPMKLASNEKYWLRRARMFKTSRTGTMKRVDE